MQHQVLIVGGGTAGVTVAASMRRHAPRDVGITIIEPAEQHYYQPAFTLVGAGVYASARTRKQEVNLVPAGVRLIRATAQKFDPAKRLRRPPEQNQCRPSSKPPRCCARFRACFCPGRSG